MFFFRPLIPSGESQHLVTKEVAAAKATAPTTMVMGRWQHASLHICGQCGNGRSSHEHPSMEFVTTTKMRTSTDDGDIVGGLGWPNKESFDHECEAESVTMMDTDLVDGGGRNAAPDDRGSNRWQ